MRHLIVNSIISRSLEGYAGLSERVFTNSYANEDMTASLSQWKCQTALVYPYLYMVGLT